MDEEERVKQNERRGNSKIHVPKLLEKLGKAAVLPRTGSRRANLGRCGGVKG